jgi:hypothetical protein
MSNKPKFTALIRGVAVFPKTNRPVSWDDAANRSVPDPDGSYECKVAISAEQGRKIKAGLDAFAKETGVKNPKHPISMEIDKETGEETGRYLITAKQYGKDRDGATKRIVHFDGKARPLPKDFILTSGSEVIVSAYATSYKKGTSLKIDSIQVVKYVEQQSRNPFSALEDGYEYEGDTTAKENDEDTEDNGENDEQEDNNTDF